MIERIQYNLHSPEITAEEYCEYLRGVVEIALQEHFGKLTDGWLNQFADKLSTSPAKVHEGVNERSLSYQCQRFSRELRQCLALIDLDTKLQESTYRQTASDHVYLTPENAPHDVIIDPTIGQFVVGYNHVFVGTRQQLKSLVLSQTGHKSPYRLWGYGSNDPYLLFEVMWGADSKPHPDFASNTSPISVKNNDCSQLPLIINTLNTREEFINKGFFYPPKSIIPNIYYKR